MSLDPARVARLREEHGAMLAILVRGDFAAADVDAFAAHLVDSLDVLYPGIGPSIVRKIERRRDP